MFRIETLTALHTASAYDISIAPCAWPASEARRTRRLIGGGHRAVAADRHEPEGNTSSPARTQGPKVAIAGISTLTTCLRRVALFFSAIRLISIMPSVLA